MTTEQMERGSRAPLRIAHNASITTGENITFNDIISLASTAGVPGSAKVTFTKYAGDMREPGYTTITLSWTT